jgi:hypothetical protein
VITDSLRIFGLRLSEFEARANRPDPLISDEPV